MNGVEAEVGAAEFELSPGDRVQWDYRDWARHDAGARDRGAFPEPFLHGLGGRAPARAGRVRGLRGAGLPRRRATRSSARAFDLGAPRSARPGRRAWSASWSRAGPAARIVRGAADSRRARRRAGCSRASRATALARPARRARGAVARTVRPGTGGPRARDRARGQDELVWLVTGLDERGVERRCARSTRAGCATFAVAVDAGRWRSSRCREAAVSLVPVYRPPAEPAARGARRRRHRLLLRARAGGRALPPARSCWPRRSADGARRRGRRRGRELGRSLMLALPLALLVAIVNPLVYAGGDTLLVRGGELLGRRIDVTLEAIVAGRSAACGWWSSWWLFGLLRGRRSRRAAPAVPALLVPLGAHGLARHPARAGAGARRRCAWATRLAAARSRPRGWRSRARRSGALDRAVDVAAALEVRGYALGGRPPRRRRPWSRHDLRVGRRGARHRGAGARGRSRARAGRDLSDDRDRARPSGAGAVRALLPSRSRRSPGARPGSGWRVPERSAGAERLRLPLPRRRRRR